MTCPLSSSPRITISNRSGSHISSLASSSRDWGNFVTVSSSSTGVTVASRLLVLDYPQQRLRFQAVAESRGRALDASSMKRSRNSRACS